MRASAGFEGMATDIEIHAREIMKTRARVEQIYAHHTGRAVEEVHRDRSATASSSPMRRLSTV